MLFNDYFGFRENPFSITPDPRYLFLSQRHQEALAHLLYGLQDGGGFVQLTGEVGTGKTTLIRTLLEKLPDNVDAALIFNPRLTAREFLASLCDELKLVYADDAQTLKAMIDALNDFLLEAYAKGRRVVLIVDEAQNFHSEVLEQIRLLTNLETARHKLLQIILVGQPELRELLARRELRQLAQRITARYHLVPMTRGELRAYIDHRLRVAGGQSNVFTNGAVRGIWRFSRGVPRLINTLCERALLGAYVLESPRVTGVIVARAAREIEGLPRPRRSPWLIPSGAAAVGLAGAVMWGAQVQDQPTLETVAAPLADASVAAQEPASTTSEIPAPGKHVPSTALASATPGSVVTQSATAQPPRGTTETSAQAATISSAQQLRGMLRSQSSASDIDAAFDVLFAAWGVSYRQLVGTAGCERAITARLHCHWASSSFGEFLTLNHPAILWERDAVSATERYITVLGARDGEVVINVANALYKINAEALAEFWNGRYLLLWRPPSLDARLIRPGARGDVVLWLRRNLDRMEGNVAGTEPADVYDSELVERVKDFQRSRELTPDGLVGERTLIHLNTVADDRTVPLLSQFDVDAVE